MANEESDWAAAYYRVERDSTGLAASKRKLRKIAQEAAKHGDPVPEQSNDVIRILDREGVIVLERDFGKNREAAMMEEARIVEDLLKLDVIHFRARYGITVDVEEPAGGPDTTWEDFPERWNPVPELEPDAEGKPEGASG